MVALNGLEQGRHPCMRDLFDGAALRANQVMVRLARGQFIDSAAGAQIGACNQLHFVQKLKRAVVSSALLDLFAVCEPDVRLLGCAVAAAGAQRVKHQLTLRSHAITALPDRFSEIRGIFHSD